MATKVTSPSGPRSPGCANWGSGNWTKTFSCVVVGPCSIRSFDKTIGTTAKLPSDAIRRTEAALRRAITAIKEAAGIPHWQLMPYRMPLIFLTAFYDRFPAEDARIDRRIAHWIWRGALTGDHEDSSNAGIQRLVKDMKQADSANDAVDALLASIDSDAIGSALRNNPADEIDREISLRRAASKVFILGLLAAEPRRPSGERQLELWDDDFFDGAPTNVTPTAINGRTRRNR